MPLPTAKDKPFLIWDFDGTIADLVVDWDAVARDLAALAPDACRGLDLAGAMYRLIELGLREPAFAVLDRHESAAAYHLLPRSVAWLGSMRGERRLAVFTDNLRSTVAAILRECNLDDLFSAVIGKEDVSRFKPDPEGLRLALGALGDPDPLRCLYIGNTWRDEQAARDTGMEFLHIERLGEPPEERWPGEHRNPCAGSEGTEDKIILETDEEQPS